MKFKQTHTCNTPPYETASATPSVPMSDKVSPPSSPKSTTMNNPSFGSITTGGQRKPPLSISTSRPEWSDHDQSPASGFAQPPRGPLPPPASPYPAPLRSATTPTSAGHKALRFPSGGMQRSPGNKSPRPTDPRRKSGSDILSGRRRGSGDERKNLYTECGRHSNDWLFGGWGKFWEKEKEEGRKDNTS